MCILGSNLTDFFLVLPNLAGGQLHGDKMIVAANWTAASLPLWPGGWWQVGSGGKFAAAAS